MTRLAVGKNKIPYKDAIPFLVFNRLSSLESVIPRSLNRKTHAYCVGLPRSGTHSLAEILNHVCKTRHEPMKKKTISYIINKLAFSSRNETNKWLLLRDKVLRIDVEASHFIHYFTSNLSEIFPKAKFILTIRNPIEWLESELNVNYSASKYIYWRALEEYRYKTTSLAYEAINNSWQPSTRRIESYISYWKNHIEHITQTIPSNRLLVINTNNLSNSLDTILDFLDLSYPDLANISTIKKGTRRRNVIRLSEETRKEAMGIIERTYSSLRPAISAYL